MKKVYFVKEIISFVLIYPIKIMEALLDEYYKIKKQEEENKKIIMNTITEKSKEMSHKIQQLNEIKNKMKHLHEDSKEMIKSLSIPFEIAEKINRKVNTLHLIQTRVKLAINEVEGHLDLKSCVDGVENAIKKEDYEKATELISNVLNLDERILVTNENSSLLKNSAKKLKDLILNKFRKSLKDGKDIDRFAKLIQPLKIEKEGLKIFSEFSKEELEKELKQLQGLSNIEYLAEILDITVAHFEKNESFITSYFGLLSNDYLHEILILSDDYLLQNLNQFYKDNDLKNIKSFESKKLMKILDELLNILCHGFLFENYVKKRKERKSNFTLKLSEFSQIFQTVDFMILKENFKKAVQMDHEEKDEEDDLLDTDDLEEEEQKCTSLVNDSFYIFKQSIERCILTLNVDIISNNVKNIIQMISSDLYKELSCEKNESLSRQIRCLNNVDASYEYILHLKIQFEKLCKENSIDFKIYLNEFIQSSIKFKDLTKIMIKYILSSIQKDILSYLDEEMKDIRYDKNDFNDHNSPFQKFINKMDIKLNPFKKELSKSNFDLLIQESVGLLVNKMESIIFTKQFNQFGGLQIEREIRILISYFSDKTIRTVRDKFLRLNQISSLLKLFKLNQVLELWNDHTITWRLSSVEVKKVLELRIDFKDSVHQLKL